MSLRPLSNTLTRITAKCPTLRVHTFANPDCWFSVRLCCSRTSVFLRGPLVFLEGAKWLRFILGPRPGCHEKRINVIGRLPRAGLRSHTQTPDSPAFVAVQPDGRPISLPNQTVLFFQEHPPRPQLHRGTSHADSAPLIVRPWNQPSRRGLHSDIIGGSLPGSHAGNWILQHLDILHLLIPSRPVNIHVIAKPGSFVLFQLAWTDSQACDKRGVSFSRGRTSVAGHGLVLPTPAHRPAQPWGVGCVACRRSAVADPPRSSSHSTTSSTPLPSVSCFAKGLPTRL